VASLTIKNLPDDLHRKLKEGAEASRRSLNGYIVGVLEEHEQERDRRRRLREHRLALEAFVATLPEVPDPTPLIREDRDR
jgi:hypothetical protein